MYRYRLMPLLTMNLSRLSFRLLLDGYACSGCHRCSRVFFSEAGHLKPGADGDSEYCEHNYSGCLGFRHGRSKSMIGNSFPAKLMSSLSSKQSELASEVGHYRKISTAISVTDESLTKALQLFFSNEKDEHSNDKQLHPNLNAYNSLLAEAAETSDFDLFCDIFQKLLISKLPPDLISYLNVARVLPSLSDSKLLKFIKEVSENTVHSDPTVVNRIIFLTAKSGQINKSVMIFEELKNHGCKIDTVTFNTVLAILGRAGQVYKMLSEFSLMKELGYSPDTVTYDTLINCLRRLGRLDLCKAFAKEMIDVGFELDLQAYTALIDGLGRAGHVNDAMILFGEMKKRHCPSIYVYRAMISNLRKFGKIEAAMDLWKEMNSSGLKLVGPEDFRKKKCRVVE
ncbi:pentatricopeptide repeat-containing protein At1g11900 isoform X2 [Phalaenopsis equestris]|uniref:pentatricopeptide repeat-containing protein At1g11900 isoform X2 n=1 Tax=Phalaenopsis equestris TaxID=78828 RepID=UPI0009E4CABB|nr:pentatricopeptide repeat-containing protein At1g11900 isoform X2 [Phalaenopsis equestris]